MENSIETIAERLAWVIQSWRSVELRSEARYRLDHAEPGAASGGTLFDSYRMETHYIETAAGQCRFEAKVYPTDPNQATHSIIYSDGKLTAYFNSSPMEHTSPDQVVIKREPALNRSGMSNRPEPLNSFYIGTEPLDRAVRRGVILGRDRALDRECDVVLIPMGPDSRPASEYVLLLDAETSIPLRVSYYQDASTRAADRPLLVRRALSLDRVDDRWFPLRSELVKPRQNDSNHAGLAFRLTTEVRGIHFDRTYPSSTFWPVITKDVTVVDHVSGKTEYSQTKTPVPLSSGSPIQAVEPNRGLPARLGIGLGATFLVAAMLVRWRRR